ncbi:hypothetical protein BGZ58_000925 [Dissophora ornata]|nr:hypothetical protein BGZ58_000925 [Dissophora ornata]
MTSSEYYPTLTRLYRSIKVKFHDADNTLSCFDVDIDASSDSSSRSTGQNKCDQSSARVQEPYLSSRSYRVNSGQTITLPDLPPFSLLNPLPFGRRLMRYYRIAKDYARMLVVSKDFLAKGRMMDIGKHPIEWGNGRLITLREFLEAGGYSHDFSDFFVPLFASVCTCSFERMMEYPACAVLEYVARCMPFGRMQFISSGVQELAEKLSKNIGTIHYNTAIEEILRVGTDAQDDSEGPLVLIDSYGTRRSFDHVIFATQANQAAETLAGLRQEQPLPNPFLSSCEPGYDRDVYGENEEHDSTDPETPRDLSMESIKTTHTFYKQIRILLKFPYERTRVVCHTDTTFLPKNPAHWRLFNIAKSSSADVLASPLAKISKELEPEMIQRSKKAQAPRSSIFSLRSPSSLSKTKLVHRKTSQSRLRTHFGPSSLEPPTSSMASHSHNSAMTTHIMNNTALNLGSTTKYLQTTNPIFLPRPDTVIASAWFERAAMNPTSMKAVDELHLLMEQQTERWVSRGGIKTKEQVPDQGQNLRQNQEHDHENEQRQTPSLSEASASDRVWFVGSYAYSGIPLLEGCVVSAVQAVERIIAAEQSLQLAASVTASQESFLKRDEPMRERRRKRREEGRQDSRGNSARATTSSVYFQTAWRDVLEDERSESGKEQSPELVSRVAGARQWSVYAELAWMLLLYVAAIAKWASVIAVESLGGDGSRWAFV